MKSNEITTKNTGFKMAYIDEVELGEVPCSKGKRKNPTI